MIRITSAQVTPAVRALFDPNAPAGLRCTAVLDGLTRGQVLTDDPVNPTWGVVYEATYGTLYPGGALNASTLAQVVSDFRRQGEVLLGFWPEDAVANILPPDAYYDGWIIR